MTVLTGLEVTMRHCPARIEKSRAFGLVSNQSSVTSQFQHAADVLHEQYPTKLKALFGPQHGLWSTEQDNMIETAHASYRGMKVHSLYSETRCPTTEMLEGLDLLVVDLQDVGTRVYTYVWTLTYCLEACAKQGIDLLVLDRPNPLGGVAVQGPVVVECVAIAPRTPRRPNPPRASKPSRTLADPPGRGKPRSVKNLTIYP